MSRQRSLSPILALTPHIKTARALGLVWGLHCRVVDAHPETQEELCNISIDQIKKEALGGEGANAVLTAGVPFGKAGSTNLLRVVTID